jgi:NADH-quinone oxidoreductase subunit C
VRPLPPSDAPADAALPATTEGTEVDAVVDELREQVVAGFRQELGDAVLDAHVRPGHAAWVRVSRDAWHQAAEAAQGPLGYAFFDFISAIDWLPSPFGRDMDAQEDVVAAAADPAAAPVEADLPGPAALEHGYAGGETRFQLLASLYSIERGVGVLLKADVPDDDLRIASWSDLYAGANWHERETWEMFGIEFTGHPDLRRLYLPADFEGHPLRKDYPLLARRVKPWPGIVDVEPMPGSDDEGDADAEGGAA